MPINFIKGEDAITGKEAYQVEVDHSDRKHPNRIFTITASESPLGSGWNITFEVSGVTYHPTIKLTEEEYKEFLACASALKAKIDPN